MEGRVSGADAPVANARRRTGGALVATGAALWLIYNFTVLAGFIAAFGIQFQDAHVEFEWIQRLMVSFFVATSVALAAASFVAAGLCLYALGLPPAWKEARVQALVVTVLLVAYAALGVIAMAAYVQLSLASGTSPLDYRFQYRTWIDWVEVYPALWIAASILLIGAAALLFVFLRSQRETSADCTPLSGIGFLVYSIVGSVGAVLFTLAGSWLNVSPVPAYAMFDLMVVPVVGIAIFVDLLLQGVWLRTLDLFPYAALERLPSGSLRD